MKRRLIAALAVVTALSWAGAASAQELLFGRDGHRGEQGERGDRGERRGRGDNNNNNNQQQQQQQAAPPQRQYQAPPQQQRRGPLPDILRRNDGGSQQGADRGQFRRGPGPGQGQGQNQVAGPNRRDGMARVPGNFAGGDRGPRDGVRRNDGPRREWSQGNNGGPRNSPPQILRRREGGPPPNYAQGNNGPRDSVRRGDGRRSGDLLGVDRRGRDHARGNRGPSRHYTQLRPHRHNYRDWRGVQRGRYFDRGYASVIGGYYGGHYRWWGEPGWRPPHRGWRLGYALGYGYQPIPYSLYSRLPPPPYGCRYVRYRGDILLIAISSLIVLDALLYIDSYDGYNDGYYDDGYYDDGYYDDGYYDDGY